MKKDILSKLKLQLPAGSATPAPPVGPSLGQYGINLIEFCKSFNNLTKDFIKDSIINIHVVIYRDKSFFIKLNGPSTSYLIKNVLNLNKGSKNSGKEKIGIIKKSQIDEIIKLKQEYLNTVCYDSMFKIIKGTILSMGLIIND